MSRVGCQCNPQSSEQGRAHVCMMYRQFAMMFEHSQQTVLEPWAPNRDLLDAYPGLTNQPCRQLIQDIMQAREFKRLWTHPEVLRCLRTTCLHCGGQIPSSVPGCSPACTTLHGYTVGSSDQVSAEKCFPGHAVSRSSVQSLPHDFQYTCTGRTCRSSSPEHHEGTF